MPNSIADYRGPSLWDPEADDQPEWELAETAEEYDARCWFEAVAADEPSEAAS